VPLSARSRRLILIVIAFALLAVPAAASARSRATIALAPRNAAALATYAQAVTTPSSPLYHHFLTVGQFARRFGRTGAQLKAARTRLAARGLRAGHVAANGLTLPVFSDTASNSTTAATAALPRGLVEGVIPAAGVAPSAAVIVHRSHRRAGGPTANLDPVTGQDAPCSAATALAASAGAHTAGQIASAYGLSTLQAAGDEGQGVTIALYELEPFSSADIAAYEACYGTTTAVTTIPVDGGAGTGPGSGEAAMDIEDVIGLAPQASIDVYEGPPSPAGAYETYSRIVADDTAQVISTSWGMCEALQGAAPAAAENTLFEEAAVQGQSVVAAAGDQGSNDCGIGTRSVDDPASQPWVTGVGGTTDPGADTVWNNALGATGGGVSHLWGRPAYQDARAVAMASNCAGGLTSCREVPDVSADADPDSGYVAVYDGGWATVGGTSVAAPTLAAYAALAEASPACAGRRIGFLNPLLYRAPAADFGAVTQGQNATDGVSGFPAGPGYDMASGLGTPTAALGAALCSAPVGHSSRRAATADTHTRARRRSVSNSLGRPAA
jgi:subtilase family serine protease